MRNNPITGEHVFFGLKPSIGFDNYILKEFILTEKSGTSVIIVIINGLPRKGSGTSSCCDRVILTLNEEIC